MTYEISNMDDIIDVRDVITRVEELRDERDSFVIGAPDGTETEAPEQWAAENADEAAELAQLEELLSDLCGYGGDEQWDGDWYPITLIRDSYFTDAMQELCEDIGDMPRDGFPAYMVIDWEATAKNLQVDYSSVEFDGVTYWYR